MNTDETYKSVAELKARRVPEFEVNIEVSTPHLLSVLRGTNLTWSGLSCKYNGSEDGPTVLVRLISPTSGQFIEREDLEEIRKALLMSSKTSDNILAMKLR